MAYQYPQREESIQLLPTLTEARILRKALQYYMDQMDDDLSNEDCDRIWKLISDISTRVRSARL